MRGATKLIWAGTGLILIAAATLVAAAIHEANTSRWQSAWLSNLASELHYEVRPGPSEAIRFPVAGPFDERLGYVGLPPWTQRLRAAGLTVEAQARMSPRMLELADRGLFPPYHEKTHAGLELRDCRHAPLYSALYPQRVYDSYADVPPLLVDALLFIENRGLFDPNPVHNPAVDWPRFARALFDQALHRVMDSHPAPGASTLATQIEKFRHSPGGRTSGPRDKLVQMASASLRSYQDGPDTRERRRQIVVDYLNSVPLSARAGFGEVIGIGDALWVWYGRDFASTNRLLRQAGAANGAPPSASGPARALKEALSLLVAQRRPSWYLSAAGLPALRQLTDAHLRLLAEAGIVSAAVRNAALPLRLQLLHEPLQPRPASFLEAKAANALRGELLELLSLPGAYGLDRVDLRADSTFAIDSQRAVSRLLRGLSTPKGARRAGLYGPSLLRDDDDPGRIAFSFTLFESVGDANLLRVQTDNLDRPFDLNEGARLDLGSTAKVRTLIIYLQQVAALHARWSTLEPAQLAAQKIADDDAIARWARGHLARSANGGLAPMLEAAMLRTYSANTDEVFFTGGGVHHFSNFEASDHGRTMTLQEAVTRSVNLPFIRLMRDVVRHVIAITPTIEGDVLDDADDPRRRKYLERFADEEGSNYVRRFHRRYAALAPAAVEAQVVQRTRQAAVPLANTFFMLEPDGSEDDLRGFLQQWLPSAAASAPALHAKHGPGHWSLSDRGYLARVHPLELWVAGYLRRHPGASLRETLAASAAQRQEAYGWLFRTGRKSAQDRRIRQQLEEQAFGVIQQAWARLGYPFQALTPSYATALGASGDRPAALAQLMGIITNDGLRLPTQKLQALEFARGTPYETRLRHRPAAAERVLPAEVAQVVRRALRGVVVEGTARRVQGALARGDGSTVPLAGKTGTGDQG